MRRSPHRITSVLLAGCLGASSAFSYDTELSSTAVREAYFLGQRHGKDTRDFLAPYSRHLPLPKSGPYISGIRLLTPFAQVVEFSNQQSLGYSAQQAWLDYRARGDSIVLEMHIEFTPTYNQFDAQHSSIHAARRGGITLRTEDFWQDFRFIIKQKEDWIEPRSVRGAPEYARLDSYGRGGLIGAWASVDYDAREVPRAETEVHVFTPDGQDVSAGFDLATLQ